MLTTASISLCALATSGVLAIPSPHAEERDDTTTTTPFADPVRLTAGDEDLGAARLYPSPAVFDWNGDGRDDVVIGDLPGRVTVALRKEDGSLEAEVKAKRADGELLDFGNW